MHAVISPTWLVAATPRDNALPTRQSRANWFCHIMLRRPVPLLSREAKQHSQVLMLRVPGFVMAWVLDLMRLQLLMGQAEALRGGIAACSSQ